MEDLVPFTEAFWELPCWSGGEDPLGPSALHSVNYTAYLLEVPVNGDPNTSRFRALRDPGRLDWFCFAGQGKVPTVCTKRFLRVHKHQRGFLPKASSLPSFRKTAFCLRLVAHVSSGCADFCWVGFFRETEPQSLLICRFFFLDVSKTVYFHLSSGFSFFAPLHMYGTSSLLFLDMRSRD